jgi:hypothetical protein
MEGVGFWKKGTSLGISREFVWTVYHFCNILLKTHERHLRFLRND